MLTPYTNLMSSNGSRRRHHHNRSPSPTKRRYNNDHRERPYSNWVNRNTSSGRLSDHSPSNDRLDNHGHRRNHNHSPSPTKRRYNNDHRERPYSNWVNRNTSSGRLSYHSPSNDRLDNHRHRRNHNRSPSPTAKRRSNNYHRVNQSNRQTNVANNNPISGRLSYHCPSNDRLDNHRPDNDAPTNRRQSNRQSIGGATTDDMDS